jgi:hypothetical protein
MASLAELYEANAEACERAAELFKDAEAKEAYLELANTWRRMARESDSPDQKLAGFS